VRWPLYGGARYHGPCRVSQPVSGSFGDKPQAVEGTPMDDSESPTPLIRTGLRDRLPRGLSHPVGAEAISHALTGCARYADLWTAFGAKTLSLHPAPPGCGDFRLAFAIICNNHSGTWYLSVPAVPSEERSVVRQLLVGAGLPAAREWLRPRPETWHAGFRTFQVGYALDPPRVCLVESLNHRVVESSVASVQVVTPKQALQQTGEA